MYGYQHSITVNGERVYAADVLTAEDFGPRPHVTVNDWPCLNYTAMRNCEGTNEYGVCDQCRAAGAA